MSTSELLVTDVTDDFLILFLKRQQEATDQKDLSCGSIYLKEIVSLWDDF